MSSDVAELERPADGLPDGWRSSRLGDVARLGGGTTPARGEAGYWDGASVPWATPSDITSLPTGVNTIASTESMVSDRALAECSLPLNPPGTVLMTSRATIGFAAINTVPMTTNQGFITFTAGRDINAEFLLHWLIAQRPNLVAAAGGSTFKELSRGTAKLLPIDLPPPDEQRRIAEVLRSVDEAIAANAALLDGVRAAKQGTMEAVLSGGFDEVRLETLLADTRYPMRSGPFGSALLKSELQPEGIPFLGIDNVHVERFVPVYRRFISDEKYRELARYTVYPGDVMVTIMGTVGRCCVVPPDVGTAISSKHVWTLTLDQERYSPALLAWQINHSPAVLTQLQGSAQGGIMSAISSGTLRDLLVPLPSPDEVQEIEALLLSFNDQIVALEAEQVAANTVKSALMSDLLSGRVRVPKIDALAEPTAKSIPTAFKRAVFAAEVVHQLHGEQRFGAVKHEKIVHLCELHLDLHADLDRHAYKKAAGPYDPGARRSVERIFRDQKWFGTSKLDGKRVVYTPLEKAGGHKSYFTRYFGHKASGVQTIIDLLRPLGTEQCEIIATLYAVWNDFLLDGRQPTDDEIVGSVLNDWHPAKKQIAETRWRAALPWMRQHGLTPRGTGEKTRVVKG